MSRPNLHVVVYTMDLPNQNNRISLADSLHSPINQAMVVLKTDRNLSQEAQKFVVFVLSE
ncbi:MAG: hypothetical protein HWE21_05905 [Cytophagia bacterium]|nr:hypothetical protein [Cytophagia bacterium]